MLNRFAGLVSRGTKKSVENTVDGRQVIRLQSHGPVRPPGRAGHHMGWPLGFEMKRQYGSRPFCRGFSQSVTCFAVQETEHLLPRKSMRALGRLLLRGGISVGICIVTALSISAFLSLIATSLQPKKQAVAEPTAHGCMPNHCDARTKGRQVVAAKAQ